MTAVRPPSLFSRLRLYAVNAIIAALLVVLALDQLPQAPLAIHLANQRIAARLGVLQGPWHLFSPNPDRTNLRLRAEITYRDGERREWTAPTWRDYSVAAMWLNHRRHEWVDHMVTQEAAPTWEHWCRFLAREQRPDFPEADREASVRVIYRLGTVPPAELRPWRSIRERPQYEDHELVLTIESL